MFRHFYLSRQFFAGRVRHISSSCATLQAKRYPCWIGSEPSEPNHDLKVKNKYDESVAYEVPLATQDHVEAGIAAATDANASCASLPAYQRKEILMSLVDQLTERFDEMAEILCVEAGKPIKDAGGEVTRAIDTFTIAAEESTRIYGEIMPLDISERAHGYQGIVKRFPVGPVSMIAPFNFPLNLLSHKIAPAIACGCPFVVKPASHTPVSALLIGEMLANTSWPKGGFSILPCSRNAAGSFTMDERFKLVSFTGSPEVGWQLKAQAGKKRVVLELGGNAACLIDETTPVTDELVARVLFGGMYQSGQSCISVQRLILHESIYDEFVAKMVSQASQYKRGDPLDESVFLGPMITRGDAERLAAWTQEAVDGGAKVLLGGNTDGGVFFDATIIENVPHDCDLYAEEAFGPVICVEKFRAFQEGIDLINESKFGLQAGVYTQQLDRAFYAFQQLEQGAVVINDVPSMRIDSMPYGGIKDSGFGREGIRNAIIDMTEEKLLVLKNVDKLSS